MGQAARNEVRLAARRRFVAGTRSSRLASWQTTYVLSLLKETWPEGEWLSRDVSTRGDETSDRPLVEIGGRGAFTEAIEGLLVAGEIDFAVHSMKDLPVRPAHGLVVAAVVGPRNAGEVLVSKGGRTISELPAGAVVGTSSQRRRAQLLRARPDLVVRSIRGNVETRIEKVERGEYDATLLAAAGIERLELEGKVAELIDADVMLPAPGQGAIAVQCRADDDLLRELLSAISDPALDDCTRAERSFLAALGGGCSAPVAALAVGTAEGGSGGGAPQLFLRGRVSDPDGSRSVDVEGSGESAVELGVRLAGDALLRGAGEILQSCTPSKGRGLLDGRRIVVTRPRGQAEELVRALEAHGARVLLLPVIGTAELPERDPVRKALADIESFRWLVFASANAVHAYCTAARRAGTAAWKARTRIAAVGPSTAAAVEAEGGKVSFIPRRKSGEALGRELPDVLDALVLVPCAEVHAAELEEELAKRGARVTTLPVYRTEQVPITPEGIAELRRGVDTILFTSGSAVESFLRSLGESEGGTDALIGQATIACIGPSTAQAVSRHGLHPQIVAEEHTVEGLVAALVQKEMERRE